MTDDFTDMKNMLVQNFGMLAFDDQTEVLRRMLDLRAKQIDKYERETDEKNGESWIGNVDTTQYTVVNFEGSSCKSFGDSGGRAFDNKIMAQSLCKALKEAYPGSRYEVVAITSLEPSDLPTLKASRDNSD